MTVDEVTGIERTFNMNDSLTVTDPGNSKKVRFTDNSVKEDDFYPEDQTPEPLSLDPFGCPYSEETEIEEHDLAGEVDSDPSSYDMEPADEEMEEVLSDHADR